MAEGDASHAEPRERPAGARLRRRTTALVVLVLLMAVAAWGVFVRSGESVRLPSAAKTGLGASLTSAFLAGIVGAVSLGIWFVDDVLKWRPSSDEQTYSYRVTQDGRVLRLEHDAASRLNSWKPRITDVVDIDDPDSRSGDRLIGQPASATARR